MYSVYIYCKMFCSCCRCCVFFSSSLHLFRFVARFVFSDMYASYSYCTLVNNTLFKLIRSNSTLSQILHLILLQYMRFAIFLLFPNGMYTITHYTVPYKIEMHKKSNRVGNFSSSNDEHIMQISLGRGWLKCGQYNRVSRYFQRNSSSFRIRCRSRIREHSIVSQSLGDSVGLGIKLKKKNRNKYQNKVSEVEIIKVRWGEHFIVFIGTVTSYLSKSMFKCSAQSSKQMNSYGQI